MAAKRKPVSTRRERGATLPLSLEQVSMLENLLKQDGSATAIRDLALLRVGVDTALRSSDVLSLRVGDVSHCGEIVWRLSHKQKKTGEYVTCELSGRTREAIAVWLSLNPAAVVNDRLFAITVRQHQRVVKQWCGALRLDPGLYSTHSIRRTKPAHIYAKTKNLAAARAILGHQSIASTGRYLGVDSADALDIARQFPI